jgi:hypothetical protein
MSRDTHHGSQNSRTSPAAVAPAAIFAFLDIFGRLLRGALPLFLQ